MTKLEKARYAKWSKDQRNYLRQLRLRVSVMENEVDFLNRDIALSKLQLVSAQKRLPYLKDLVKEAERDLKEFSK